MTVKEYLLQIKNADNVIKQMVKDRDKMASDIVWIHGIDYAKDRVQTSAEQTGGALKSIERLYDLERKLDKMIDRYVDLKSLIIDQIDGMDTAKFRDILYMRYINFMSLEEIACEMHYSYYRTAHYHGDALQEFDRLYKISK